VKISLPFNSDAATARKWKPPSFARGYPARRVRGLVPTGHRVIQRETVADPEDFSTFEGWRQSRLQKYFASRESAPKDPRGRLPILPEDTASTLANRYGTPQERSLQAQALESLGLPAKARRLALCGRLGHRIDHERGREACNRKFFEPYFCREKYCTFCGPQQFRELFAKLQNSLASVAEGLVCDGSRRGRQIVIAKLDFTVPNDGRMPSSQDVRRFHADLRRFWRAVERDFGIERSEYGVVRCDEIGGSNTNLHCHCAYVGPWLPQKRKELSNLWSKIRGEQSFVSIKRAKSFVGALAHALKYPAKFLDKSTPERLAALEKSFHRTRRVSTGGAFYRVKGLHEPGDRQVERALCPFCKVRLVQVHEPWQPLSVIESEGRVSLRDAVREAGLHNVLAHESPP
jgi:hypothetical protein